MNILAKALKSTWQEPYKTVNDIKCNNFEQYVKAILFPRESYDLELKKGHININKDNCPLSLKTPDYKFIFKKDGSEFYVETRFRAKFQDQILEWCKFFELKRYQDIDMVTPVIIAIGLGGRPAAPERVFLVPVKHVKFVKLYPSLLQKYELNPGQSVGEHFLRRVLE